MNQQPERKRFKVRTTAVSATVEHDKTSECAIVGEHNWQDCEFWKQAFGGGIGGIAGSPAGLMGSSFNNGGIIDVKNRYGRQR